MSDGMVFGITLKSSGGESVAGEVRLSRDALREVSSTADQAAASTNKLSEGIAKVGAVAIAYLGVSQFASYGRAIIDTTVAQDRFNNTMAVATGSAKNAAAEYEYIRQLSSKLGLEIKSTADAYASFQAASRGTSMEGEKARAVFESVSNISARMSLTVEQNNGVFLALSQMMSKGVVSAEEFRQQLGERLPIATTAGAKALGVTTAEFVNLLNSGQLLSEDFLPKFAVALNDLSGGSGPVSSMQASLNRLSNSFTAVRQELGQEVPIRFVVDGADAMISNTRAVVAAITGATAAAVAYGAIRIGGMAMEAVAGLQAKSAALAVERAATLAAANAEVERTAIMMASARSNGLAMGSTTALTAATNAHTAALAAQTAAQAATTASVGIARGALMLLGGPIGAITLALGVGVAAWQMWGNSAKDAAKEAGEAVAKAKSRALEMGVSEKQALEEDLAKAHAERERLKNTGASGKEIKAADDKAWALREALEASAIREKNLADAQTDSTAWDKLAQTKQQKQSKETEELNAIYLKQVESQRGSQEQMLRLAEEYQVKRAVILEKYKDKSPSTKIDDRSASLANSLGGERAGLESAQARNEMDALSLHGAARIEAERTIGKAQEDARYQAKAEALAREYEQLQAHDQLTGETAMLQAQRMQVLEQTYQENLTGIDRKAQAERDQLKEKQDAAEYRSAQSLGSERAGLDAVVGQNKLADPNLRDDARIMAERAVAQASEDARYKVQVDALIRDTELMASRGELTEAIAATQAQRREVMEETHQARMAGIQKKYLTAQQQFEKKSTIQQIGAIGGILAQATAAGAARNRTMFEINKVAGVANAIVSTYEGATRALSLGPWGIPLAAVITAAGLANVAAINATQFDGGMPSGGGAGSGIPSLANSLPATPTPSFQSQPAQQEPVTIHIYNTGTFVDAQAFVDGTIIPQIRDQIANADVLIIDPRSRQAQLLGA